MHLNKKRVYAQAFLDGKNNSPTKPNKKQKTTLSVAKSSIGMAPDPCAVQLLSVLEQNHFQLKN